MKLKLEVLAKITAKENLSQGEAKAAYFCSAVVPDVKLEVDDGISYLVIAGEFVETPNKGWDGVPRKGYRREVSIRLGPETRDALLSLLIGPKP